jgi:hypothetical protein
MIGLPLERNAGARRRPTGMRLLIPAGAACLALGAGGCFMPALELVPLGVQAVEAVGSGAAEVAVSAARSHSPHPGEDEIDRQERCDDLQLEVPGLIELRADKRGDSPQWRELTLGGSTDAPQWQPMIEKDTPAGGWHSAQNLATMKFAPSLESSLDYGAENYMAYAPAEPATSFEQDKLVALTIDFGAAAGTFQWKGRVYQYSVVRKLPCFPPPVAMK